MYPTTDNIAKVSESPNSSLKAALLSLNDAIDQCHSVLDKHMAALIPVSMPTQPQAEVAGSTPAAGVAYIDGILVASTKLRDLRDRITSATERLRL